MSQTTTSIFASPGIVLPPTSSNSISGRTPLTVPKLVVSDTAGKALQSWDLKLPKGTLGSAESCTICCPLPGIAPIHALLISGSRQAFVRSLAGKLTQDGIPASELLLSDDKCYFEIAGYRFNLLRASVTQANDERKKAKRMQFALARPLSISSTPDQPTEQATSADGINAPWVANVIREAIEPLEAQIDSLLLPLAEFQAQSLQAQLASARINEEQRSLAEKERKAKEQEILGMVAQHSASMETLTERIGDVNNQLSTIERIIARDAETNSATNAEIGKVISAQQSAIDQLQTGMVAQHSATMETLTERIGDVNNQLSSIERIMAQDAQTNSATNAEIGKVISVQQSAIEQLQTGMVSVSESLKQLQERQQAAQQENSTWKNEVQQQLQQLTSAVSEFSSIAEGTDQTALVDAIESLKQTHEVAQLEIGRWQSGVQQQLQHLQETLHESDGRTQAEIPSVIAEALSELQTKHEQSLQELQSWKTELKLEMQQLFQSASTAAVQSALEAQSHASKNSDYNQPASAIDYQLTGNSAVTGDLPISMESQSFTSPADWAALGSSEIVTQVQPELDEPVNQELIHDQFISQFQSETDEASPAWGSQQSNLSTPDHVDNSTLSVDNDWPTLEADNHEASLEFESPASQFTDQWSAQSHADVFENDVASAEPFSWACEVQPQEDSDVSTESSPLEYDLENMTTANVEPAQSSVSLAEEPIDYADDSHFRQENEPFKQESTLAEDHWGFEPVVFNEQHSPQIEPSQFEDQAQVNSQFAPITNDLGLEVDGVSNELGLEADDDSNERWLEVNDVANDQRLVADDVANVSSSLPNWWTNQVESEPLELEDSQFNKSELQSFDHGHLYDESISDPEPQPSGSAESDQVALPRMEADPKPDDDEQFFGFGLEQSHQPTAQQQPSHVMSIDQLALQEVEDREQENIFDFTPRNATEEARYASPIAESQVSQPATSPSMHGGPAEDDSVEAYMKSLLARMRGEAVVEPEPPKPVVAAPVSSGYAPSDSSQQSAARQAAETAANSSAPVTPFDFENYVPLTNAPEKGKNISALRDLANSTARTAIHKSTRNRTLSGSLMKFAISAIAITVAAALFAINGLTINIALVATLAALCVALIWGYDGLRSLKPLLQNSLVLQPVDGQDPVADAEPKE